jgi:hypothetical protein
MKQTYTLRLDMELHEKLKDESIREGESLSGYVTKLVTSKEFVDYEIKKIKSVRQSPRTRDEIIDHVVSQLPTKVDIEPVPVITCDSAKAG